MAWVSWDTMTIPKLEDALGFKDLGVQNLALFAKQCWKVASQPQSLLSRLLKGKYFRYSSIMNAEIGTVPSWGWHSILKGRKVVEKGLVWRVGDGSNIRIFSDAWLAPPHSYVVSSYETSKLQNQPLLMVKDLILSNGK
ncbi:uncharacterized protein LOC107635964 [Arachis ipaensis]|uniref:uncharacterized protein LOC107635964 n=1 Tax=Arachis ipaensis TaxID=130454 RepID=UPI0007AF2469|nr:uncharacterized protein LOC107635964 [Arachis ipaensis]